VIQISLVFTSMENTHPNSVLYAQVTEVGSMRTYFPSSLTKPYRCRARMECITLEVITPIKFLIFHLLLMV
jgi:hypothetical protein